MTLYRKLMLIWLVVIGAVAFPILGMWWINPAVAVRNLQTAIEILEKYEGVFLLWRLSIYAGLFFGWPAIGRYSRKRSLKDWSDQEVRDFNRYRWRLLAILLTMEIVVIQKIPFTILRGIF